MYKLDETGRYYERIAAPVGFKSIPPILKIDPAQRDKYTKRGIKWMLESRVKRKGKDGKSKPVLFTGLIASEHHARVFYGDHKKLKYKSFMVIQLSTCNNYIIIDYLEGIRKHPADREPTIYRKLNEPDRRK